MIFGGQALMNFRFVLTLTGSLLLWISGPPTFAQGNKNRAQKESQRHYQKWLKETVVYIISPQEKDVFQKLTTTEERDKFIEQFWSRRDPDPTPRAMNLKKT